MGLASLAWPTREGRVVLCARHTQPARRPCAADSGRRDYMVMTDRIQSIFQDARELQTDALEMLSMGKIRNAAEKAWVGRSGPATPWCWRGQGRSRSGRRRPARDSGCGLPWTKPCGKPACGAATTAGRSLLHGECFYNGLCEPLEDTERRIRRTAGYIEDAAEGETP